MSDVHRVSDVGESSVSKIHFILNKEALFREIWKEPGIRQSHSGSAGLWDRTFKELWNSGAPFISGFRILEGLLTRLGCLKSTAPFDSRSQAMALVQG